MWSIFSLEQVSYIKTIAPRNQEVSWIFCKSNVPIPYSEYTVTGLYRDKNEFNISFFPVYLRSYLVSSCLVSWVFIFFSFLQVFWLTFCMVGKYDPSVSLTNFTNVFLPVLTTSTRSDVKILELLFTPFQLKLLRLETSRNS